MSEGPAGPAAALGLQVNVGIDVEEVARFEPGNARTDVLFTDEERAHADASGGPAGLAGTWCAKEATVKALWPWVRLDPRRVVVKRDGEGRPSVEIVGHDTASAGLQVQVSISHTGTVASAAAVVLGPPPGQPPFPSTVGTEQG